MPGGKIIARTFLLKAIVRHFANDFQFEIAIHICNRRREI